MSVTVNWEWLEIDWLVLATESWWKIESVEEQGERLGSAVNHR